MLFISFLSAFIGLLYNTYFISFLHRLQRTERSIIGGPQATCGPRPLVIKSSKLFINLLLATTSTFIFLSPKVLKNIVILISSTCFRTSTTYDIDLKTLP
jgi:hypothetical protein